jgi:hypothetical protein
VIEPCDRALIKPFDRSDIGDVPDSPRDEAALAHEWEDHSAGPAPGAPIAQERWPSDPPNAGQAVNAWISDHIVVGSILALAAVCLIVAAGNAAFGKHGIWIAIEILAVLVCASGAYLWNRAHGTRDPATIARFRAQTLGGAVFVVLIAIRIATKAY